LGAQYEQKILLGLFIMPADYAHNYANAPYFAYNTVQISRL
jgi:hypothetical protein